MIKSGKKFGLQVSRYGSPGNYSNFLCSLGESWTLAFSVCLSPQEARLGGEGLERFCSGAFFSHALSLLTLANLTGVPQ
jgi:hypothetical protein